MSVGPTVSYGGMASAYIVFTWKDQVDNSHAAGVGKEDGERMMVNNDFVVGSMEVEQAEDIVHHQMKIILAKVNGTKGTHIIFVWSQIYIYYYIIFFKIVLLLVNFP